MNKFQQSQLIFWIVVSVLAQFGSHNEKETGIATVDDLVATVLDKGALQFRSREAFSDDFTFQGTSFDEGNPFVIGRQTGLTLFVAAYKKQRKTESVRRGTEWSSTEHQRKQRCKRNVITEYCSTAGTIATVHRHLHH